MPKGSVALTKARKEEIINACEKLYQTKSFKDITLQDISKETSFTRTSIYNYFQTKEEIFLALLKREYDLWNEDLENLMKDNKTLTMEEFASALSHTLEKRETLLKLMSMNHYDMEASSRIENLVCFKTSYGQSLHVMTRCLGQFFPSMSIENKQGFLYAFFPFLFGIYPYTYVTEKQKEAMEKANANYVFLSLYEITYSCVLRLLKSSL